MNRTKTKVWKEGRSDREDGSLPRIRHIDGRVFDDLTVRRICRERDAGEGSGPTALSPETLIDGRYRLQEELTPGGMSSAVWVARDERHPEARRRVLKFLPQDIRNPDLGEIHILELLHHPHICRLCDFITDPPALVLEYVEGVDLAKHIEKRSWGEKKPEQRLRFLLPLLEQIAHALDHCGNFVENVDGKVEQICIVHLDIKPSNIFIVSDERGGKIAKLGDFGLGRVLTRDKDVSATGGTLPYMPPEQVIQFVSAGDCGPDCTGAISPASDIYSLAAAVYECLSGKRLITGGSPEECAAQILSLRPQPVPGLPDKTNRAIMSALQREPERRPRNAVEFVRRLDPEFCITSEILPSAYTGRPYNFQLCCSEDGRAPYQWELRRAGDTGLRCSRSGRLAGMPDANAEESGEEIIAVCVRDADGRLDVREFALAVEPYGDLRIATHELPAGFRDRPYSVKLHARGGEPPYRWGATGLPMGLMLNPDGLICGEISDITGPHQFQLQLTDGTGIHRESNPALTVVERSEFIIVEAGCYRAGLSKEELTALADACGIRPEDVENHFFGDEVESPSFGIGRRPVSNGEYFQFVDEAGHPAPRHWRRGRPGRRWLGHPVTNVTYKDAQAYCRWRGTRPATALEWDIAAGMDGFKVMTREWTATRTPAPSEGVRCGRTLIVLPPAGNAQHFLQDADEVLWWQHRRGAGREFLPCAGALPQHVPVGLPELEKLDAGDCNQSLTFREVIDLAPVVRPEEDMVRIPSGVFAFGPDGIKTPVAEFEIARYAVHNEFYAEYYRDYWQREWEYPPEKALHPAAGMSFADARTFCAWLTKRDSQGRCYSLPSPLEWERAVRGAAGKNCYPWGNIYSKYRCNSIESGYGDTVLVCDLPMGRSPEGIANLCGNAGEFVDNEGYPEARGGDWLCSCSCYGQAHVKTHVPPEGHSRVGFRYIRRKGE